MPDDSTRDRAIEHGLEPVVGAPDDADRPEHGTALCLSGGGYRAMLFHAGAVIRLNELGLLPTLKRVSSVSGGTITAAVLGSRWHDLRFVDGRAENLLTVVIDPLRSFAERSIDKRSVITGFLTPFKTVSSKVASAYDKHLFHGKTLRDLPDRNVAPLFVINATNVQTGKLVRFNRDYIADYTVGQWFEPDLNLCDAVAASSAFPPFLSPHTITPKGRFVRAVNGANTSDQFTTKMWLSDGGVYDNLGLEAAWKRYDTILVSDGGGHLGTDPKPNRDWARHGMRVANIADSQVRAQRRKQAVSSFVAGTRHGTYWGIRSDIDDFKVTDPLEIPIAAIERARTVPTGLSALDRDTQVALINWGYTIADTAMRRWVTRDAHRPTQLPVS